jgi:hypothetical protein
LAAEEEKRYTPVKKRILQFLSNPTENDKRSMLIILLGLGFIMAGLQLMMVGS